MKNEFFKIIPIAYNKEKNIIDNTVLWNDTNKHLFEQSSKTYSEEKINYIIENSDFNTEYFKIKGQYLIISNEPIPMNTRAYMEIKIYNYPRINDIRHLGLCVGVHELPTAGVLKDTFCMGNVYYTRPYNAKNEFGVENDNNKTLYGSREYLAYKVIEHIKLATQSTYQFKKYKDVQNQYSIDISPPMRNSVIRIYVDMEYNLITISVNDEILYEFSPKNFKLNSTNIDSKNSPKWIQEVNPSRFHFAMYTVLPDIEIEGEFNLGRTNLLNEKIIKEKTYIPLYLLYNNKNLIDDIYNISTDNIATESIKRTKIYKENLTDITFKHNNNEQTYIYIDKNNNKILKENNKNTEKIYVGRRFYTKITTIEEENKEFIEKQIPEYSANFGNSVSGNTILYIKDILSLSFNIIKVSNVIFGIDDNKIVSLKEENKSAFNFYSRTINSIFKLNTKTSDLSIIENKIPKDKIIYFEFKTMYAYLQEEYIGIPFYIGLTNAITSSNYSSVNIDTNNYFKIPLFRKKSSNQRIQEEFNIIYTDNKSNIIKTSNGITLLKPVKFEQGEYIGVKIDLENKEISLYINSYVIAKIQISDQASILNNYMNKNFYFFFQIEEVDNDNIQILEDSITGYVICNFGENENFNNKNIINNDDVISLYDFYNIICFEYNINKLLDFNFTVENNGQIQPEITEPEIKPEPEIIVPININNYKKNNILTLNFSCYVSNTTVYNKNVTLLDLFSADSLESANITHSEKENNNKLLQSKSMIILNKE